MMIEENFEGVDKIEVQDIKKIVSNMKRSGIGVIIKENNVREKIGIIDSEYIINEGKVMKNGRKEEIVEKKDVRRIYIGEKFKM